MTKGTLCSVLLLASVALVSAQGPRIQATLRDAKDRSAAPAFRLADAFGKPVRLAALRGQPVVLNLWATECGGCKEELPTFVELSQAYKGLAIIGVSMDVMYEDLKSADAGWALVKPFVAAHKLPYPIVVDDGTVEKAFNVTSLPATYLIDRSDRVAATYIGVVDPANLDANIRTLLAER